MMEGDRSKLAAPPQPTTTVIHASRFQPFESRQGVDTVVKLDFQFDRRLVLVLKRLLTAFAPKAIDPARHRHNAGGWLPQCHCWFIEEVVWPGIRAELEYLGYRIEGQP